VREVGESYAPLPSLLFSSHTHPYCPSLTLVSAGTTY
jgi:hypothetical protein